MSAPVYDRWGVTVYQGDCLDVLGQFPDDHFVAIITDPPYSYRFMNRDWDAHESPQAFQSWCERWATECLRVLRPGGHLLAFGGTRTYHRLTCGIEDAGFTIRDSIDSIGSCISWVYGNGFPKSRDISKEIDKRGGDDGGWFSVWLTEARKAAGLTRDEVSQHFLSRNGGVTGKIWNWEHGHGICTQSEFDALCDLLGQPRRDVFQVERDFIAARRGVHGGYGPGETRETNLRPPITAAATDAARQWQGWGTALKPAHEPIVVARKPFRGSVAANVLAYGTGALNIDACRVGGDGGCRRTANETTAHGRPNDILGSGLDLANAAPRIDGLGRWPPNVVLSHPPLVDPATGKIVGDACADGCVEGCAVRELDQQSGTLTSGSRKSGTYGLMGYMGADPALMPAVDGDSGGASRFMPCFRYEAKAPTHERPRVAGEAHNTVKPLALMRWLVRLVTPPSAGPILDPFAGSGPTGQAARAEGHQAVLIEKDPAHIPFIVARLDGHPREDKPAPGRPAARDVQLDLFGG